MLEEIWGKPVSDRSVRRWREAESNPIPSMALCVGDATRGSVVVDRDALEAWALAGLKPVR